MFILYRTGMQRSTVLWLCYTAFGMSEDRTCFTVFMDPYRQILELYLEEASTGSISVSHERRSGTKSRVYDRISRNHW